MLQRKMLTKADEAALGGDEAEVRREDQEQINRFSRLHAKVDVLEAELKLKAKDKEDLEEISGELELADEDDKINYKIGDSFIALPLEEVQSLLAASSAQLEEEAADVEKRLAGVRDEMSSLKVQLYARFGRSINLET